jgi:hypothetical protein
MTRRYGRHAASLMSHIHASRREKASFWNLLKIVR